MRRSVVAMIAVLGLFGMAAAGSAVAAQPAGADQPSAARPQRTLGLTHAAGPMALAAAGLLLVASGKRTK